MTNAELAVDADPTADARTDARMPRRLAAVAIVLPEGVTPPGTRGRILEAALGLFAELGYHGTSIRTIGVSSRHQLGHDVLPLPVEGRRASRAGPDRSHRAVQPVDDIHPRPDDPAERLTALVHAQVLAHAEFPLLAVVTNSELHVLSAEAAAPSMDLRIASARLVHDALEDGRRDGSFDVADVALLTQAIAGMGVRVGNWFGPDQPYTREKVADSYAEYALRMAGAPPAHPARQVRERELSMKTETSVDTRSGTVVGAQDSSGILSFKGIPFAAPPIGERRFQPPHPPEPWAAPRPATEYGPTAPQTNGDGPLADMLPNVISPGDDYLNLNVWTPSHGWRAARHGVHSRRGVRHRLGRRARLRRYGFRSRRRRPRDDQLPTRRRRVPVVRRRRRQPRDARPGRRARVGQGQHLLVRRRSRPTSPSSASRPER